MTAQQDEKWMALALEEAKAAAEDLEVPVGAVIVQRGVVVGRGRNRREKGKNALAHAEIEAINEACQTLGGWRLPDCTLYVTLEPCPMCAGAICNARIDRVVYGCKDERNGAFGSVFDMNSFFYNHKVSLTGGVLEEENTLLLRAFFQELRRRSAKRKEERQGAQK